MSKISSKKILAMNLKYLRKKYNLSQEEFAEIINSSLVYVNQLENEKRKATIDMLDKIADNLNIYDKNSYITSSDLLKYDKTHKTNFIRIDEK